MSEKLSPLPVTTARRRNSPSRCRSQPRRYNRKVPLTIDQVPRKVTFHHIEVVIILSFVEELRSQDPDYYFSAERALARLHTISPRFYSVTKQRISDWEKLMTTGKTVYELRKQETWTRTASWCQCRTPMERSPRRRRFGSCSRADELILDLPRLLITWSSLAGICHLWLHAVARCSGG